MKGIPSKVIRGPLKKLAPHGVSRISACDRVGFEDVEDLAAALEKL